MSVRWKVFTFTRPRLFQVGAIVLLVVLGLVLPYLTLDYINFSSEPVRDTQRLSGAANLLGSLDPTYLPGYVIMNRDQYTLALNVLDVAPNIQLVAGVVALLTCWGQFMDEINKFLWWPLHLVAYPLVILPVPLFIGLHLLRATNTTVSLGPAWVPGFLLGVVALVVTFRSRSRLDSYGGI